MFKIWYGLLVTYKSKKKNGMGGSFGADGTYILRADF